MGRMGLRERLNVKAIIAATLQIVGVITLAVGIALIYLPAGIITLAIGSILFGVSMESPGD